jgi:hypothetical protein
MREKDGGRIREMEIRGEGRGEREVGQADDEYDTRMTNITA